MKTPLAKIISQEEKRIKKKVGKIPDSPELISQMGQDSEVKAAKVIIEEHQKEQKIENEKSAIIEDILTPSAKKLQLYTYRDLILQEGKRRLKEYEIPANYYLDCGLSKKGMLFGYRHVNDKQWFMKGLTLSFNPKIDLFAISLMINWALDQIGEREKEGNGFAANGRQQKVAR